MQCSGPLLSVITPMFRAADTLEATLNSLLRQDEARWESILVDDGSPDASRSIAEDYVRRDPRFRLLSQSNAGVCVARNQGLAAASGRYVLFLDADDWMHPAALGQMVGACERDALSAVFGGFRYARADGTATEWTSAYSSELPLFEALASSNVLSVPSCVMLRRSLLDQTGDFDPSLAHCGDWDLWARVARSDCRIGHMDECVTFYRMRAASLSRNPLTLLRDATEVLERIHAWDRRVRRPQRWYAPGADRALLSERIAGFTLYAAALAAMQGNSLASRTAMDSIAHWPALPPQRVAEFLLHAACFSRCQAPEQLHPLPNDLREAMERLTADLARRSGDWSLARQVEAALSRMGFGRDQETQRDAQRQRLGRPLEADETLPQAYLRSLALREIAANA